MARITMMVGAAAAVLAGAMALSTLADGMRQTGRGQQAKPS